MKWMNELASLGTRGFEILALVPALSVSWLCIRVFVQTRMVE